MRIPFEFTYEVNFMLVNGRRPATRTMGEGGVVDIPEISLRDAPIAARWTTTDFRGGTETRELRLFDGQIIEPAWNAVGLTDVPNNPTVLDVVEAIAGGKKRSSQMPPANTIRHRMGDSRNAVMRNIQQALDRLIIVDGNPYARCPIPKLNLTDQDGLFSLQISRNLQYYGRGDGMGIDRTTLYHLGELNDVLPQITERHPMLYNHVEELDVFLPEAFEFDKLEEMVGRTVGQALVDNAAFPVGGMETHLQKDLIDVRSEYRSWVGGQSDVDVVDMLNRVYEIYMSGKFYHQDELASFLQNYDTCQTLIPHMQVKPPETPSSSFSR